MAGSSYSEGEDVLEASVRPCLHIGEGWTEAVHPWLRLRGLWWSLFLGEVPEGLQVLAQMRFISIELDRGAKTVSLTFIP